MLLLLVDVEEGWDKDTALLHTKLGLKWIRSKASDHNTSKHTGVEFQEDLTKYRRTATFNQDSPQYITDDCVKCLGTINKRSIEVSVLFPALFLQRATKIKIVFLPLRKPHHFGDYLEAGKHDFS